MVSGLKHRWSLQFNPLAGLTAGVWWRLLREVGFGVDPVYWHRAVFVTLASLMNSAQAFWEQRRFGAEIAAQEITEPPLFILGHWRSGTTHLHNLLAQDTEQFAFPNTYQVVAPRTFLSTESFATRCFAPLVPKRRPMDNMELKFSLPQEEEFAPCLMTLLSPYIGISFPRHQDRYDRYLTFRGVPGEEVRRWREAWLWFLKKVTYKYGRALLLKSPPHTARVRLLLEMFPRARFVHIHRDPYAVYQSTWHYFDTAGWHTYLQRPDLEDMRAHILRRYVLLHEAFFEERGLIPSGQFHEVAFADLERDPVGVVGEIYERLGLGGLARARARVESYARSLDGYRKNRFEPLAEPMRRRIARCWARCFEEWGYPV